MLFDSVPLRHHFVISAADRSGYAEQWWADDDTLSDSPKEFLTTNPSDVFVFEDLQHALDTLRLLRLYNGSAGLYIVDAATWMRRWEA